MGTIIALILFPMVIAGILTFLKEGKIRDAVVKGSAAICAGLAMAVAVVFSLKNGEYFSFGAEVVKYIAIAAEVLVCAGIIIKGLKNKGWISIIFATVQTCVIIWFEIAIQGKLAIENNFCVDGLAIIVILASGILGAIAILSHDKKKEILLLVGATSGIAVSNDMVMMYMFWMVSAIALWSIAGNISLNINLFSGIVLVTATIISGTVFKTIEISELILIGSVYSELVAIPAAFMAVAALARAGQAPFSTWITRTSSMPVLISGAYLLIRISPLLGTDNYAGIMVMICGGISLLMASMAAVYVTETDKVLPYWMVGIYGILTACCGVGTSGAVWAAMMLLISSGIVGLLVYISPVDSPYALGGMVGMVILPFGYFASRWGSFTAIADTGNLVLLICMVFGVSLSAVAGIRMISRGNGFRNLEKSRKLTMVSFVTMILIIAASPVISTYVVIPYLEGTFGGLAGASMTSGSIVVTCIMVATLLITVLPKFKNEEVEEVEILTREDNIDIMGSIILKEEYVVKTGYVLSSIVMVVAIGYIVATLVSLLGGAA